MKACVADGSVTAEGYVHDIGSALHLLRKLAVLKGPYQVTAAATVVNVQEIVVRLNTEAVRFRGKKTP